MVVRHWGLERLEGLDAAAERARAKVLGYIERLGRLAQRFVEERAGRRPRPAI